MVAFCQPVKEDGRAVGPQQRDADHFAGALLDGFGALVVEIGAGEARRDQVDLDAGAFELDHHGEGHGVERGIVGGVARPENGAIGRACSGIRGERTDAARNVDDAGVSRHPEHRKHRKHRLVNGKCTENVGVPDVMELCERRVAGAAPPAVLSDRQVAPLSPRVRDCGVVGDGRAAGRRAAFWRRRQRFRNGLISLPEFRRG